jgi:hypothetical protein
MDVIVCGMTSSAINRCAVAVRDLSGGKGDRMTFARPEIRNFRFQRVGYCNFR